MRYALRNALSILAVCVGILVVCLSPAAFANPLDPCTLIVIDDGYPIDGFEPPPGVYTYDCGTSITLSAPWQVAWWMPCEPDSIFRPRMYSSYNSTGSIPPPGARPEVTFTLETTSAIEWIYSRSEPICIVEIASDYGVPNPARGTHFYDPGYSFTAWVDDSVIIEGNVWYCSGWIGTGAFPASGSLHEVTVTLGLCDTLSEVTWQWIPAHPCSLTVIGERGNPDPPSGIHAMPCGQLILAHTDAAVEDTFTCRDTTILLPVPSRGFRGTGSITSGGTSETSFRLTETSTLEWLYSAPDPQAEVHLTCDPVLSGVPVGEWVYPLGQVVDWTPPETVWTIPGIEVWVFAGWSGDGDFPAAGAERHFTDTLECPRLSNLTWHYYRGTLCSLIIASPYPDNVVPPPGTYVHACGDRVTVTADSLVSHLYPCGDHMMDRPSYLSRTLSEGSVTGSYARSTFDFVLDRSTYITFEYGETPPISEAIVHSRFAVCTPDTGERFFMSGTVVDFFTPDTTRDAFSNDWWLRGWLGLGAFPPEGDSNRVTVAMCENPNQIDWQYVPVSPCTLYVDSSRVDTLIAPVAWMSNAMLYACADTAGIRLLPSQPGYWVFCSADSYYIGLVVTGFTGTGVLAGPHVGDTIRFPLTGTAGIVSIDEVYHRDTARVEVTGARRGGSQSSDGVYIFPVDDTVRFSQAESVQVGESLYVCLGWEGTWRIPYGGAGNETSAYLCDTVLNTIVWHWESFWTDVRPDRPPDRTFRVQVWPQPAGEQAFLWSRPAPRPESARLTDLWGRISEGRVTPNSRSTLTIELDGLPAGLYWLSWRDETDESHVTRIIHR